MYNGDLHENYNRWNEQAQEEERQRIAALNASVTIYHAQDGFKVYWFPKGSKVPQFKGRFDDIKSAQDFLIKEQGCKVADLRKTDHWVIRSVDQFGIAHYQRWEVDTNNSLRGDPPHPGWAYDEELVKWYKDCRRNKFNWRPPFVIDEDVDWND